MVINLYLNQSGKLARPMYALVQWILIGKLNNTCVFRGVVIFSPIFYTFLRICAVNFCACNRFNLARIKFIRLFRQILTCRQKKFNLLTCIILTNIWKRLKIMLNGNSDHGNGTESTLFFAYIHNNCYFIFR